MAFRIEPLRVPPAADYEACEALFDVGPWGRVCLASRLTFPDGRQAVVLTPEGCSRYRFGPAECLAGAGDILWGELAPRATRGDLQPASCLDPDAPTRVPIFGILLFACAAVGLLVGVSFIFTALFAMIGADAG